MGAQYDSSKKLVSKGYDFSYNPSRVRRNIEKKLISTEEGLLGNRETVKMGGLNKVFYAHPVDQDHPYCRFVIAENEEEVVQIMDKFIDDLTFDRPFIKYHRWWLVKEERHIDEVDLTKKCVFKKC